MTVERDNSARRASVLTKVMKGMAVKQIPTAKMSCFATLRTNVRRMEVVLASVTVEKGNSAKTDFALTKVMKGMAVKPTLIAKMSCFATLQTSVRPTEVVLVSVTVEKGNCARTACVLTKVTKGMAVKPTLTAKMRCFATPQTNVRRMEVA